MTEQELVELCSLGESTTVQYKLEFTTQKQIAEELVAFANTHGGVIVFGAEDNTGRMVGLTYEQIQYISRELGTTANDHVRPVIYVETENIKHKDMVFMVAHVRNGAFKPYKDLSGNIWVKQGADKRRACSMPTSYSAQRASARESTVNSSRISAFFHSHAAVSFKHKRRPKSRAPMPSPIITCSPQTSRSTKPFLIFTVHLSINPE